MTYEIVPSVPAIKVDSSGTVTTGIIGITAYRTEAGTRTSCSFSASGSKYYIVYFSVDGGQWRACSWIYPGGGAATVYGVPSSYVQSAKVGIAFRLSLHDNNATPAESVVYETQGISVVEDGAKGNNGTSVLTAYSLGIYPTNPQEGVVVLINYSDPKTDMIDVYEDGQWEGYSIDLGAIYICDLDHHYYEATATGWRDCGRFTGEPGQRGADAVTYEIVPSVSAIRATYSGTVTTGLIRVSAYKTEAGVRTYCNTNGPSDSSGTYYRIYYRVDSGSWTICQNIYDGSAGLTVYGVPASAVAAATVGIAFRLVFYDPHATATETVVHETGAIPVVKDGVPGSQGAAGKFYYYDGFFDPTKTYTSTSKQAPYIAFEYTDGGVLKTLYYMLVADSNLVDGTRVAPRTSAASGIWELMETSFKYMITEATFSDFAKLASAVFSGDWLISQYGLPAMSLSREDKQLIHMLHDVDGQYELEDMAAWWDADNESYDDTNEDWQFLIEAYDYTIDELKRATDIAVIAVAKNLTYEQLQAMSDTSYQLFGQESGNLFRLFAPNIALDMLTGKAFLQKMTGRFAPTSLFLDLSNSSPYCLHDSAAASVDGQKFFVDLNLTAARYIYIRYLKDRSGKTPQSVGVGGDGKAHILLPEVTAEMLGEELVIVNATYYSTSSVGYDFIIRSGTSTPFAGSEYTDGRKLFNGATNARRGNTPSSTAGYLLRLTLSPLYEVRLRAVAYGDDYGWIASSVNNTVHTNISS